MNLALNLFDFLLLGLDGLGGLVLFTPTLLSVLLVGHGHHHREISHVLGHTVNARCVYLGAGVQRAARQLRNSSLLNLRHSKFLIQIKSVRHLKILADVRVLFVHVLVHVVNDAQGEGVFNADLLLRDKYFRSENKELFRKNSWLAEYFSMCEGKFAYQAWNSEEMLLLEVRIGCHVWNNLPARRARNSS
jgi:hypothetical protein